MTSSSSRRGPHHQQHRRPAAATAAVAHNTMRRVVVLGLALLLLGAVGVGVVEGFKYKIADKYPETAKWSFTEAYMYGSGKGPLAWRNGDASVDVDLDMGIFTHNQEEFVNVSVLFYHASSPGAFVPDGDLCALEFPGEASDVQLNTFAAARATEGGDNAWKVKVQAGYKVATSGVQNVLFQLCPTLVSAREVDLAGEMSFLNPYGYLPGRFYGYLPFELSRFLAFLFFDLAFLVAVIKNRRDLLRLHWAILLVLIVATLEALAWFLAFDVMNNEGVPYCCPFPPVVVFAMVCELFQKTFSRALLLVICLGYGIARPKLHKGEWLALLTLTLLYLGASMLDEASEIAEATQIKNDGGTSAASLAAGRMWWSFPALLCDIVFLSWIYMSLVTMMKILREQNETYKLEMYRKLSSTIVFFVTLFGALTVVVLLARVGFIQWPWNLLWAETVSWEVLNFAVLAAVCWIWRPSPTSKFLAQAKQLPTSEAGAHGEEGIEFSISSQFSIADDEDLDDDDEGYDHPGVGRGAVAALR